jgi:hypothetical protein
MIRFSTLLGRLSAAVLLGSMLVLAGCHRGASRDAAATSRLEKQFDVTIQAYKSGQFLVDGAVLSAVDTGSHFAYLKDQGKLPKTVLLVRSDDSKIRKQHLQFMARMALDYGFTVYYDDGGELRKMNAVETKARDLEDYHQPVHESSEQQGKDASSPTSPMGGGY